MTDPLSPRPLAGRVAVVTGGAAGIGGGITRLFARAGAHMVVNDIDASALTACLAEVAAVGGSATAVEGDITEAGTVAALVEAAEAAGAGAAGLVLVNNVGDFRPGAGRFARTDEADWDAQYAVTLQHVFRCTQAFLPGMVEQGRGAIVNVATVEAFRAIPRLAAYGAFNAALVSFTKTLAVEVGGAGVRVNAIAPDLIDTPQTPAAAMLAGRSPEAVARWVPLARFGSPDDVAAAALFLASDASAFVTGHTLPVDGGTTAASGWYRTPDGKAWTNLP